jgi:hypothetical protein
MDDIYRCAGAANCPGGVCCVDGNGSVDVASCYPGTACPMSAPDQACQPGDTCPMGTTCMPGPAVALPYCN